MDATSEPPRAEPPLPLQPMAVGDLLDSAFRLLRAKLGTVLLIAASFLVPLELLSVVLDRVLVTSRVQHLQDLVNGSPGNGPPPDAFSRAVGGVGVGVALAALPFLLAMVLTGAAVSKAVAADYLGQDPSAGAALRATGRRLPALFGSFIMVHLLEGIGVLFCFLPALVPMAFFLCTTPAIMIEDLGAFKGMARSASLVQSRFWQVLGIGLLSGLIAAVVSTVLRWPFELVADVTKQTWGAIPAALSTFVTELVMMPFTAIVATLVYLDARVRLEGLDLQLMRQRGQGPGLVGGAGGTSLA